MPRELAASPRVRKYNRVRYRQGSGDLLPIPIPLNISERFGRNQDMIVSGAARATTTHPFERIQIFAYREYECAV